MDIIKWSDEKNEILKETRDICFEDVINIINSDEVLDVIPHYNIEKYPNQMLLIVAINEYTFYVPFVMEGEGMFLKNIIPSRKYHKIYGNKEWIMYTEEELKIVKYIEEENPKSVENKDEIIAQLKIAAKNTISKRKAINLKVLESDIAKFKSKAMQEGMGYQTLINSVLHKYITGQLVEKKQVS